MEAELFARFQTSQGMVDVVLQYQKVPQTVANFVTLVEGTRAWVDPKSGAVTGGPYFDGTKIHRISNNSVYKFAQGGSRIGDGSDGPGFTIKDEIDPSLTHVPYVLSMANAGPNTNGGGFFFTGNVTIPEYDGHYSLFGLITDPASRLVIDAMIAAGANGTTIDKVTILRTDPDAIAFNENAWNLPVAAMPGGGLNVTPGVSATWYLNPLMVSGDVFRAFGSTTLASGGWSEIDQAYTHLGTSSALVTPVIPSVRIDNATLPKAFYNLSLVHHPASVAPSSLANRTVLIRVEDGQIYYAHNAAGTGGNATFVPDGGAPLDFTFNSYSFDSGAHHVRFIVENVGVTPENLLIKIGCDSATNIQITGHHTAQQYNVFFGWQPFDSGPAAISR